VTVPTVERGLWLVAFCSIDIAGDSPSISVDIRLLHQLQELARVGRQRLHVAPLPFRVQRVEGERTLARARQAGDHHQLVPRQVEIEVLEIVGARTAHANLIHAMHPYRVWADAFPLWRPARRAQANWRL
jgi:hypothetical protein